MDIENKELGKMQSKMHADFFNRAKAAKDSGYYLETIFLEYAAIEGRLEVILGMLGLPCNKDLDNQVRKDIKISARISCLDKFRKKCPSVFEDSKLDLEFFSPRGKLRTWIISRNTYVHGLYKDALNYKNRTGQCKEIAENGLNIVNDLYNEAGRIRRLLKAIPHRK